MSAFLFANENIEMKCSENELIDALVELYTFNYKLSQKADRETLDAAQTYQVGTYDGAVTALGAILLKVVGGHQYLDMLERIGEWVENGNVKD